MKKKIFKLKMEEEMKVIDFMKKVEEYVNLVTKYDRCPPKIMIIDQVKYKRSSDSCPFSIHN
jgi:hypothetical protein